ncbi:pentapeptide repeat-containing protein [Nostoc sp.]
MKIYYIEDCDLTDADFDNADFSEVNLYG